MTSIVDIIISPQIKIKNKQINKNKVKKRPRKTNKKQNQNARLSWILFHNLHETNVVY